MSELQSQLQMLGMGALHEPPLPKAPGKALCWTGLALAGLPELPVEEKLLR